MEVHFLHTQKSTLFHSTWAELFVFMKSLVPPGVESPRPGTARDRQVCGPAPVLAGRLCWGCQYTRYSFSCFSFRVFFQRLLFFSEFAIFGQAGQKSRHLLTVKLNCFGYFHMIINRGRMVIGHLMATEPGPCVQRRTARVFVGPLWWVIGHPERAESRWAEAFSQITQECELLLASELICGVDLCSLLWESSSPRGGLLPPSICVRRTCLQLLYF